MQIVERSVLSKNFEFKHLEYFSFSSLILNGFSRLLSLIFSHSWELHKKGGTTKYEGIIFCQINWANFEDVVATPVIFFTKLTKWLCETY